METTNYLRQTHIWAKRTLALTLLSILTVACLFAQTETCRQIGNGVTEYHDFPFAGGLSHSYSQQIFKIEELLAEDIEAGDEITALALNYFSETPTIRPIRIYLGNTTQTQINQEWISINDMQVVFESNCQTFSKGEDNWTKITLDNEFSYTGSNVVVAILMNKEATSDPTNCFTEIGSTKRFYTHNNELGSSRFAKDGLSTPITFDDDGLPKTSEKLSGNPHQRRNNIKFCKIGPLCPKVSGIQATNITDNSISLDWQKGSTETDWEVEYGPLGFIQGEGTTLSTSSLPLEITNLSAVTSYDFYIRAICSEQDKSTWAGPKTFSSSCGTITSLNYLEEFTDNSNSLDCWTIIDVNGDGNEFGNGKWNFSNNKAIYIYNQFSNANDWLISPKIKITEASLISFDYKASYGEAEKFSVWAITGESPNNYNNAELLLATQTANNDEPTTMHAIPLQNFANQEIYIAIKCESDANKYQLEIDNFRVHPSSTENNIISFYLPTQTGPAHIDSNNHEVNLEISISTDLTNLTPQISVSEFASIDPESNVARDFSQEVTYNVKAQNGDIQEWKVNVKNAPNKLNSNDILNFSFQHQEGEAHIDINTHTITSLIHWEKPLNNISPNIEISPLASISPESGTPQDFTNEFTYQITAENGNPQDWKITINHTQSPLGANCENPVILDFSSLQNPHSIAGETTEGLGNSYSDTNLSGYDDGEDKIYKLIIPQSSIYTIETITTTSFAAMGLFTGCPSENNLITAATSDYYNSELKLENILLKDNIEYFLMIDNYPPPKNIPHYDLVFTKNENPDCTAPNDLSLLETLQTSVKLSWSAALSESSWELKYGPKGFNPEESGILINENVSSPYTLLNLSQDTEYAIHIRSKCSDADYSQWSQPVNLRTLESCPTPIQLSISSITLNSAEISWNGLNANNWILEYKLSSETDYQTIETNNTTYSLTGLSSSLSYTVRVKAICEEGQENLESQYSEAVIFLTLCANITELPYHEDFENYGSGNAEAFPNCWARPREYQIYGSVFPSIVSSATEMSSKCLCLRSENTEPTIATTPIFEDDISNFVLEFTLRRESENAGTITIGTMTDPNDHNTFTEVKTITPINNSANNYSIKFSDYQITGNNKSIAFKHSSLVSYSYYFLDDVKIRKKMSGNDILHVNSPEMLAPGTINNIDHSITGTTSYNSNITQQSPIIVISEFASISPESGSTQDFSNPVTYTVTAEDNTSQVWTITLNTANTPSSEKNIYAFTFQGQVGDEIIDYEEHTVSATLEWNSPITNINPDIEISNFASISPSSGNSQDFSQMVEYIITAQDLSTQTWKITINQEETPIGANCENPKIIELSSLPNNHTIIGETTKGFANTYDNTDAENYDNGEDKIYKLSLSEGAMYTITMNSNTPYSCMALFLGCPSENILIKKGSNSDNLDPIKLENLLLQANQDYFLMVDNWPAPNYIDSYDLIFTKTENPPCTSPNNLLVYDILQTSVKVSWSQALNENNWEIKYGPIGFNPEGSGTLINNAISPLDITGLNVNTNYHIYIRSKCSETDIAPWFGPVIFTTPESCPKPTNVVISSITTNSANVSWHGYNATNWIIEYKKNNETEFQTQDIDTNPFELTNLENSSAYTVRLKAKCGENDLSQYSDETIFFTICENISTLPFSEDFDDYITNFSEILPSCWTRPVIYTSYNNTFPSMQSLGGSAGTSCIEFKADASTLCVASTPTFNANIEDLVLEFELTKTSDNNGRFIVGVMTNPNDINSFTEIVEVTPFDQVSIEQKIKFSDYSIIGANKSIAFKYVANTLYSSFWLDNIKVREKASGNDIIYVNSENMLAPADINYQNHSVTGIISSNSDLTQQSPTITISDHASISPESQSVQNFTNTVTYTVTAENGSPQNWQVTLTKASEPSNYNNILSFSFPDQIGESIIDTENASITAIAKWNINLSSISPTIEISNFASISPASNSVIDFSTGQAVYIVTAENQVPKEWTVTINLENSPCLNAIQTPFLETFLANSSSLDCWTINNHNNDIAEGELGKWTIVTNEGLARYLYSYTNSADDWLVSPQIKVSSDDKITFNYRTDSYFSEKFSIYVIPTSPLKIADAINILPTMEVNNESWQTLTPISLSQYADQDIFIAIRCESNAYMHFLEVKNFSIGNQQNTQYKIVASAEANGSIQPLGETFVNAGETKTYTITPNANFQIDKVLVDGTDRANELINGNTYTFTEINSDHTIVATFKAVVNNSFKINASVQGGNGNIAPAGEVSVLPNQDKSFTITPNENYKIDKVLVDGIDKANELINGNTYTFTQVNANHSIVAKFKVIEGNSVSIIASVEGGHGNINPSGTLSIVKGTSQSFTITPDANFQIDKLLIDGTDKANLIVDNKYTFENVQTNHTIIAKFKPAENTYTITCSVHGGNGSISPTSTTLAAGENLEISITPKNGYILDKLLDNTFDKKDFVEDNKYILNNIQENHNIVAKFEVDNNIIEETDLQILIFPNPTDDILNIELSKEISKIEISSLDGKSMHIESVNSKKLQYHTNKLAEGNYIIRIYTKDNKIYIRQFSVSR